MHKAVGRATTKLRRSAQLLEYRRLNWRVETNHRIRWEFEAFIRDAREVDFPLVLTVRQYDTPNEGVVHEVTAGIIREALKRYLTFSKAAQYWGAKMH